MKMTWKENFFLKFENFVLLDALGSAWLQNSIFEKDHFWLERQFDPASDERNDSRISCYVKESVGDNPADGRNIKTSTESNIQVWLKSKSHVILITNWMSSEKDPMSGLSRKLTWVKKGRRNNRNIANSEVDDISLTSGILLLFQR